MSKLCQRHSRARTLPLKIVEFHRLTTSLVDWKIAISILLKNGPLFSFLSFQYSSLIQLIVNKLPMTGFETQISGVGSKCSTNCATNIAQLSAIFVKTIYLWNKTKINKQIGPFLSEFIEFMLAWFMRKLQCHGLLPSQGFDLCHWLTRYNLMVIKSKWAVIAPKPVPNTFSRVI